MPKDKKRPSKKAKAAQKAVSESKLLAVKAERDARDTNEFRSSTVTPKTTGANKLRPEKKKG